MALPDRPYTAAEVDTALEALVEPGRLAHAQDVVVHSAPALQRILAEALSEGGWFGEAHDAEVSRIAAEQDEQECARALSMLVAEQTRLGMFVGVAVGFELAHELAAASKPIEDPLGGGSSGVATGGRSVGRGAIVKRPIIDRGALTMQIRFLGHAAFELSDGDTSVLIDPFLTGNPKAAVAAEDLSPDTILLTHGHGDHIGDTVAIAKRTNAHVVAIVEIANELGEEGLENVHDPNLGGTVELPWGSAKLVPAWHTSTTPKGTVNTPAGLIVKFAGKTIYHLGDTALFSDLALISKQAGEIDVALMCIGGHYTMDRHDAVEAARMIGAKQVIPCHYDTFPPIETDAQAFKGDVEAVGSSEVIVLAPGDTHSP